MKILVAGDTHGSLDHLSYLCATAVDAGAGLIVQVGDFGYVWSLDALRRADMILEAHGIQLWWLDGNHENFDLLEAGFGASPDDPISTAMSDRIVYLPRGYRFTVDGVRCMAFGGAVSIDRQWRKPGVSWWPQETITEGQVRRAMEGGGVVDVLFCHDSPNNPRLDQFMLPGVGVSELRDSALSRSAIDAVVAHTKPRLVIHGHYHGRYTHVAGVAIVEGLSCNGTGPDSWIIIDTDRLAP